MAEDSKLHRRAERLLRREKRFHDKTKGDPARGRDGWSHRLIAGVRLLWRMMAAWAEGRYHPPRWVIVVTLAALAYFLNPLDILPDFIPILGWLDDLALYLLLATLLAKELRDFAKLEEEQARMKDEVGTWHLALRHSGTQALGHLGT